MVAEKPSIAQTIADALSDNKATKRKGRSPVCPVFDYEGKICGKNAQFRVTSVAGHIYNRDFPAKYSSWEKTDPVELFNAETIKKEANSKMKLIYHLAAEARDCSLLILWLDCDREGENICFEVMSIVQPVMRRENFKQIYRAQFSSLVKADLKKAFQS